ncbi:MAG: DUF560 domain-containing protein [Sphingomonadaceae bacterium]|nr:DUF560 domain-containing protein [Sphingomonadaceae bacterium]
MRRQAIGLLLAGAALSTAPAAAQENCANGVCSIQLTPAQLLQRASALVAQRRFDEARPMVAALAQAPGLAMETHFLSGYIAVETGDLDGAITQFRAALDGHPEQTRIRLELARAMMLKGKDGGADYNFRLAEQDGNLPPEILATIRASRGLLRDRRTWHASTSFGFAPDTNITNGTSAETIDLTFGDQVIPLTLSGNARARSGIGQTAGLSAGWRKPLSSGVSLLLDVDGQGVNYSGTSADDYTAQLAAGPEFKLSESTTLSAQAIGSQRWYGGQRAATQFGGRFTAQRALDGGQRVGLTFDARHTNSGFSSDYDGWSLGAYATYERVVAHSFVASANLFARTDRLRAAYDASSEYGLNLGVGGELPHGINAGLSGGVSRASFDAPLLAFSADPRGDWRFNARAYLGLRSLRVFGFSPSVTYNFSRDASSLQLYDSKRSRLAFNLAHYF